MKKIVVDTNVFLRFILNDVKNQTAKAETLFRKGELKKVDLLVPQIVIFEIEFALNKYYQFSRKEVSDKLETVLSAPFLTIEEKSLFLLTLSSYRTSNLSFVDCFLIQRAAKEEAEIFSFDKKLTPQ